MNEIFINPDDYSRDISNIPNTLQCVGCLSVNKILFDNNLNNTLNISEISTQLSKDDVSLYNIYEAIATTIIDSKSYYPYISKMINSHMRGLLNISIHEKNELLYLVVKTFPVPTHIIKNMFLNIITSQSFELIKIAKTQKTPDRLINIIKTLNLNTYYAHDVLNVLSFSECLEEFNISISNFNTFLRLRIMTIESLYQLFQVMKYYLKTSNKDALDILSTIKNISENHTNINLIHPEIISDMIME